MREKDNNRIDNKGKLLIAEKNFSSLMKLLISQIKAELADVLSRGLTKYLIYDIMKLALGWTERLAFRHRVIARNCGLTS